MAEPTAAVREFAGQTILITGASRGIGAHLADSFRRQGAHVAACARTIGACREQGYSATPLDVTDESQMRAWIRSVYRERKRIDVLINNAGAAVMNHCLLTPVSTLRTIMELNYLAAFSAAREAAKYMRKREYGRIVNLTTIAVPMLLEGELAYASSKAALETATRIMAAELAPFGITCNLVGPSPVDTDLIRGVPKDKLDALLARLPLASMATVEDVLYAVQAFARPEASQLTGQVLYLGGVS